MTEFLYRQFEDRFRGSRDDIQRRQTLYLPVIERLKKVYPDSPLLDLGCGRGEWLELSARNGWHAVGIDIDESMVEFCLSLGLEIEHADALGYLASQPDETISVATGFHIAEHLPFDVLQKLIREIFRILKPGGIMILETPNPENITVATCTFYLDPSHRTPLPPDLLSFLTESIGFHRLEVIRLNESPDFSPADISMKGILYGVSPDYALVAQKGASRDILGSVLPWAGLEGRGCSLFEAGIAFDNALHRHLDGFATHQDMEPLADRIEEFSVSQQELNDRIEEFSVSQQELNGRIEEEISVYRQELHAVYSSSSWRLTAPLRYMAESVRWFIRGSIAWLSFAPGSRPHRFLRKVFLAIKRNIQAHPRLKALVLKMLIPFPNIEKRLKSLGRVEPWSVSSMTEDEIFLTSGAREIYEDLKKAMDRENEF